MPGQAQCGQGLRAALHQRGKLALAVPSALEHHRLLLRIQQRVALDHIAPDHGQTHGCCPKKTTHRNRGPRSRDTWNKRE